MVCRTTRYRNTLRNRLWAHQHGLCCYCERPMADSKAPVDDEWRRLGLVSTTEYRDRRATIEHLHRKTDGGTGELRNLALACALCNHGRGAIDWLTYKTMRMGEAVPA